MPGERACDVTHPERALRLPVTGRLLLPTAVRWIIVVLRGCAGITRSG
jgi:hypothetical protein